MKRAWPYALALAVVVTGCYLALVPLLRSLNPGPTATQSAALQGSRTTTVSSSKNVVVVSVSPAHGFTALDAAKKTVKKAAKKSSKRNTPAVSTPTHEFVTPTQPTTSNTASSSSSTTTPPPAKTTPVKTTPKTTAANNRTRQVGGTINQADNGGFAGKGNGDSTMAGGKSSTLAPGN
jgi:hypothetical protein